MPRTSEARRMECCICGRSQPPGRDPSPSTGPRYGSEAGARLPLVALSMSCSHAVMKSMGGKEALQVWVGAQLLTGQSNLTLETVPHESLTTAFHREVKFRNTNYLPQVTQPRNKRAGLKLRTSDSESRAHSRSQAVPPPRLPSPHSLVSDPTEVIVRSFPDLRLICWCGCQGW